MRLEPRDDWVYWMLLAHYASTETRKRFWKERPDDVGQFLRALPDWDALQAHLVQEAQRLAAELVQEGYHTVTGFARGVDETVAQTTLQYGGKTVGVLAQGLLHRLTQQAARAYMHALNDDRLLLLSELHPNTPWAGKFAMMRNRIVAGLADFLIIVEAGAELSQRNGKTVRSGTFECAKIAHRAGRPVYALDLPAAGNQQLLAQGIAQRWGEPTPHPQQGALF